MSATTVSQDIESPLPFPKEAIRSEIPHDNDIKQELETVKESALELVDKVKKKKCGKKRKYGDLEDISILTKVDKKRKLEEMIEINQNLKCRVFMLETENNIIREANEKMRENIAKMKGCKVRPFIAQ